MNKKEFEKLEKYLQLRNGYTKQNPKDKEEIAQRKIKRYLNK